MVTRNEHALRSLCPIAGALDVLGDHWTLIIVRDLLLLNKHEFGELLEAEEGISTNILTDRLAKLQQHGLLASIPHPDNRKRKLYYLTDKGKDLIHVLMPLSHWARKHLPGEHHTPAEIRQIQAHSDSEDAFVDRMFTRLAEWETAHGLR